MMKKSMIAIALMATTASCGGSNDVTVDGAGADSMMAAAVDAAPALFAD